MLLLGLVLIAVTGVSAGLLATHITASAADYAVNLMGHHLATLNIRQAFVTGLALATGFSLGLVLLTGSVARRHRRRAARRAQRSEAARIRAERDALAGRVSGTIDDGWAADWEATEPLPPSAFPWAAT